MTEKGYIGMFWGMLFMLFYLVYFIAGCFVFWLYGKRPVRILLYASIVVAIGIVIGIFWGVRQERQRVRSVIEQERAIQAQISKDRRYDSIMRLMQGKE